jgi:MATE family, multidrug efflux pump
MLLQFALPTLASNILQSLNGSINAIWVSRLVGVNALAATSNANLINFLLLSTTIGFGMAATVLIGQSIGRRDVEGARRTLASTFTFVTVASLILAAIGWIITLPLLRLLGTPAEAYPEAVSYLRVMFLAIPANSLNMLMFMGLRAAGETLTPLWFMALSAVIDVSLNPILIAGWGPVPAMGVAGSAMATLIASYVTIAVLIGITQARWLPVGPHGRQWSYLKPDITILRLVIVKGTGMGFQILVMCASALTMIGLVNRLGVATTAAYGVSLQVWTYIQMPAVAIGTAVSAMVAQNIGAGAWGRVGRIARSGVLINIVITGAVVAVIALADRQVMGLFLTPDSPAMTIAQHINRMVSWTFILFGVNLVLSGVMRANGAVMVPLVILVVTTIPVRLGLAVSLFSRFGGDAIWWSFSAATLVSLILTSLYFAWGRWRVPSLLAPASPTEEEEQVLATTEPAGRISPLG